MPEDAECAVCHQAIPKGRVHYGGVSCYSCRAFFRRNTQREELPICKGEGRCRITYMDRKQCSSCRYTQCIRTGMRPELVLNEEDKKRRFKKLLKKKAEEASSMTSSHEPRYLEDESLYERTCTMPPLEPIEPSPNSSLQLARVSPFTYPFPPSPSSLYSQSLSPPALSVPSQQWKRHEAQKSKIFIRPETDFLSELRSDVKNYDEIDQYEHKTGQTCSSLIPQQYSTSSHFSIPSSAVFQVKPPSPWMPSPPSSPEERLPMALSRGIKDAEARHYFANKGSLTRNPFPDSLMRSPDSLRTYLVAPDSTQLYVATGPGYLSSREYLKRQGTDFTTDLSKNILEPRPSVITNHSCNYASSLSPCEDNSDKIKLEKLDDDCETKSEEEYDEKNLETTPVSSAKVYLPMNLSISKDKGRNEPSDANDDLILKYVHKKFRTQVDNSETFPQKRKSVIFHASTTKKICVE